MGNPFDQYLHGLPKELRDAVNSAVGHRNEDAARYVIDSVKTIYLREGGDDSNSGDSEEQALATFRAAWDKLDVTDMTRVGQRIDMKGSFDIGDDIFTVPLIGERGNNDLTRPGGLDGGNFDFLRVPVEIYASPDFVRNIDVASTTTDAINSLVTLTVNDTLTVDELKGKYVRSGQFGWAYVHSNTANDVVLGAAAASLDLVIGTWGVYEPGGTLNVTSYTQFSLGSYTSFSGIGVTGGYLSIASTAPLLFLCGKLENSLTTVFGTGMARAGFNYMYSSCPTVPMEGFAFETYNAVFDGSSITSHGSGGVGRNEIEASIFDGCGSLVVGNWESATDIEIASCWIVNSPGYGIVVNAPYNSRINNTRIDDCAGGVSINTGGGHCRTYDVVGSGNTEYGFKLMRGGSLQYQKSNGANTVTGTAGDIRCGGQEYTWAEADTAYDAGEDLDDLHINELTHTHWNFQTNSTDGWIGGFYDFSSGNDDFSPSVNWGTANVAVAAHLAIVTGASNGAEVQVTVTGRSITDAGVETASDTEIITIPAGAVDRYFETTKKWNGQVSIEATSGTPIACNYGWVKYWDHDNQDFRVVGLEALWESDATDSTSDIKLIHHSAAGWTYQAAGGPLHSHIAQRSVDYTDNTHRVGSGAWKRVGLNIDVNGSDSEGILVHVVSGTTGVGTLSFRSLDFTASIKTGLSGLERHQCRIGSS